MYDFIDINEKSLNSQLPTEAVKFNGAWLDQVIPGFRTLSVKGRESYNTTITDEDIPIINRGRRFIKAIQEPRTITVKFQLLSESANDFRTSINALHTALVPQQKQLIFNDEKDKFFIATCSELPELEDGLNKLVGELHFYCSDPLKYSTTYKTETLTDSGSISVDTDDCTSAIITVTANSNLTSVQLTGLSRNRRTGTMYPITIKNLKAGVPVVLNGETLKATQNNVSKFTDSELDLKAFPTLRSGVNSIGITKSSDAVEVTVLIKYRSAYV